MSDTTILELVSPSVIIKSTEVEMVVIPGKNGNFGVLPHHSLMISIIRPGLIDIYLCGKIFESIFVSGGVAEVNHKRCTLLVEEAISVNDLKSKEIHMRLKTAESLLKIAKTVHEKRSAERERFIAIAQMNALSH